MTDRNLKAGSRLETILAGGQFAVTGEIGPPKNHDAGVIREKCALLKGYVDAANITDNQTGIVRMSSIAAGILIRDEGLEPVGLEHEREHMYAYFNSAIDNYEVRSAQDYFSGKSSQG